MAGVVGRVGGWMVWWWDGLVEGWVGGGIGWWRDGSVEVCVEEMKMLLTFQVWEHILFVFSFFVGWEGGS